MAETQKPLEVAPATQEPVVTADAPAAPVPETVTPAVEPLVPETHKQETAVTDAPAESTEATTAPAEEKVTKHAEPVEPIYHGALGYKPSGGLKGLYYSKKYFFFGEETPVDTQSLGQYLRGEKPEVAHPTAAWSSHTGKGVLYFVKHASSKDTPQGALLLADATDVQKEGTTEFSFKIAGHKHSFQAVSSPERNGWLLAVEKVVEEAKTAREEIVNSEGYKATIEKLGEFTLPKL
ncbi:hypothetical protein M501DRAFT_396741 [Patellaria atrata CBS 101060]|uniref:Meiotic expression up-regulated protein 6 PH domain-containing protein n=1 Tax=Patellaria atrata CBS 101060 TaxID=1346257 RepID=A0A9P4SIG9_9PEZI|nr:hypothetical protein M501DRAFT_396741 [Patellaria atrata CBS 101060]